MRLAFEFQNEGGRMAKPLKALLRRQIAKFSVTVEILGAALCERPFEIFSR